MSGSDYDTASQNNRVPLLLELPRLPCCSDGRPGAGEYKPARPGRVCGCAAQSAAPLPPTRALRRHTAGALWGRLADGTVGCVACAQ